MSIKVCCIDGNIGSGKSSVLKELRRRGYIVYFESLNEWENELIRFYNDPKRWSFTLQMAILIDRKNLYNDMSSGSIIFVERSNKATLAFSKVAYDLGFLDNIEMKLLEKTYDTIISEYNYVTNNIVSCYIDTNIDTCMERMKKRGRKYENIISYSYLDSLNKAHTDLGLRTNCIDGLKSVKEVADDIINFARSSLL